MFPNRLMPPPPPNDYQGGPGTVAFLNCPPANISAIHVSSYPILASAIRLRAHLIGRGVRCFPVAISCCTVSVWPIKFDPGRETDRYKIEGPQLAVIIVVHPENLLYHPASEVEDRLVWRIFMFWMANIIVINKT